MKVGSGALQDLHVFSNLKLGKPVYESDTDPRTMNVVLVAVVLKCNLKIYTFDFFTVGNVPTEDFENTCEAGGHRGRWSWNSHIYWFCMIL